jgi:hypothetical protein
MRPGWRTTSPRAPDGYRKTLKLRHNRLLPAGARSGYLTQRRLAVAPRGNQPCKS